MKTKHLCDLCLSIPGVFQGGSVGSVGGHEGLPSVSDPHHRSGHVQREADEDGTTEDDAAQVSVTTIRLIIRTKAECRMDSEDLSSSSQGRCHGDPVQPPSVLLREDLALDDVVL